MAVVDMAFLNPTLECRAQYDTAVILTFVSLSDMIVFWALMELADEWVYEIMPVLFTSETTTKS